MRNPLLSLIVTALVAVTVNVKAQNWEYINTSSAFYEAPIMALSDLNGFDFMITNDYPDAGRLLKAVAGTTDWVEVVSPNYGYGFNAIAKDDNGVLYATSYQDAYSSTDNGDTWSDLGFDVSFRENCNCGIDPFWCDVAGLTAIWIDLDGELIVQSRANWRWASCYRNYRQAGEPVAKWYNLQYPYNGEIGVDESFRVYGQIWVDGLTAGVGQAEGIKMWVGRSAYDTPATSGSFVWYEGEFNGDRDNNDEYKADVTFPDSGTYYIATRYQVGDGQYIYGGLGGPWNGTTNNSIIVTVNAASVEWCNVQWPQEATIELGGSVNLYAQAYMDGVTTATGIDLDLQAWIGYRDASELPWRYDWTWVRADYNGDRGNNDEYKITLTDLELDHAGDYQIMSRFQYGNGDELYGGIDGPYTDYALIHVNGPEPVNIGWCNLQWPGNVTISSDESASFYAQIWVDGITGTPGEDTQIEAWIGYNDGNVSPDQNGWNWVPANWLKDVGSNDEYKATLGSLPSQRYYVASRFSVNGGPYVYGGFSQQGGNFWGNNSSSSILDVLSAPSESYKTSAQSTSSIESATLSQNYPNPFTASTKFEVKIPKAQQGEVVIFDLLGHQLASTVVVEGTQNVQFDGSIFHATGLHLAILTIEGQIVSKTMLQVIK